jgi:hypothetical protein
MRPSGRGADVQLRRAAGNRHAPFAVVLARIRPRYTEPG